MYSGLAKIVASEEFILNLGVMTDILKELSNISEALQRDDVTMACTYQLISCTIHAFEKMKDHTPEHIKETITGITGIEQLRYSNVPVIKSNPGGCE